MVHSAISQPFMAPWGPLRAVVAFPDGTPAPAMLLATSFVQKWRPLVGGGDGPIALVRGPGRVGHDGGREGVMGRGDRETARLLGANIREVIVAGIDDHDGALLYRQATWGGDPTVGPWVSMTTIPPVVAQKPLSRPGRCS